MTDHAYNPSSLEAEQEISLRLVQASFKKKTNKQKPQGKTDCKVIKTAL